MPAACPAFVNPCIPFLASKPPIGEHGIQEVKWDGWRYPDQAALSFHAFDLLHLNGVDFRGRPLRDRRRRLQDLVDSLSKRVH